MKAFVSATSFLKPQNAAAKLRLEELFDEVTYNDSGAPLHGSAILKHLEGCDAYIAGLDYITADVIENMPQSVKVISRYGVGVDRVDVAAAEKRGIVVTNTPGANSTAVCELAFGLMLSVARNIPALHTATQKGEWPRYDGIELREKNWVSLVWEKSVSDWRCVQERLKCLLLHMILFLMKRLLPRTTFSRYLLTSCFLAVM